MTEREASIPFVGSLGLLASCIALYYLSGIFGYDFPVKEVGLAIPLALAGTGVSAWVNGDRGIYRTIFGFLGSCVFGTTVITGMFLIFEIFR